VIFPDALTLLVSAHGIFDPLADDFQAAANMNRQLAHGSPPDFLRQRNLPIAGQGF
jgi:hypothetical protein